jgi:hypothetical protein
VLTGRKQNTLSTSLRLLQSDDMSFCNVSDVGPGVRADHDLFVILAVLEEYLEPFKGRGVEILWLFDRVNYRLNGTDSLEHR